jgi:hypothetical protein
MPFTPSNETRFFAYRAEYMHLTLSNIEEMLKRDNCPLLFISDKVIDHTGVVRAMSETEMLLLPKGSTNLRVISDTDHPEQKAGEMFLTNCGSQEDYDDIGWQRKRAGNKGCGSLFPVFVWQNEIFPGSYIPES